MTSANYCRLCLQKLTDIPKLLHKDLKLCDMLKHLFPGMNFNLVEAATICEECFKYIQFSYTMRVTVIKNEEKLISHRDSIDTEDKNICRLCLTSELSEATLLYENKYKDMSYMEARSIIEIAIVEMRFELFKKPVVCKSCWQIVKTIYLFKKRCFTIEKVLKFYSTQNNLSLLNPKILESVSNCYNSHLQKLFEDSKYNLTASLAAKESIKINDCQTTLGSVDNFIRPVDIYLNNFTTDNNPDDIFEEEADDVFVEIPEIVKEEVFEAFEPFLESIKENTQKNEKTVDEDNKSILKNCIECVRDITENIAYSESDKRLEHILSMQTNKSTNLSKKLVKKRCRKGKSTGVSLPKRKAKIKSFKKAVVPPKEILLIVKKKKQVFVSREEKDKTKLVKVNKNQIKKQKELDTANDVKKCKDFVQQTEQNKQINDNQQNLNDDSFSINIPGGGKEKDKVNKQTTKIVNYIDANKHCKTFEHHHKKEKKSKDVNKAVLGNKMTLKNKKVYKKDRKKNGTYVCDECGLKTKYKQHLGRHKLIHNKSGQLLTCSKCLYSTFIKRNFNRHALTHRVGKAIQCTHCSYGTFYAHHMKKHMLTHQNISLNCDTQNSVENKQVLIDYRCKECPYETNKEIQMAAHLRCHKTTEKILKCTLCHYITTRSYSLKGHMEIHNEESNLSKKTFKCKQCAFVGKRYTHLVSHMITHQNNYSFSCCECSYKAKRKSHLVTHMMRHKKGIEKDMLKCSYCKYKTIRKDHLKQHYINKHFDKESVNSAVIDHKNGSRPEKKKKQCPYCSYKNKEAPLENHILTIHFPSTSKIMQCNDCNYQSNKRKRLVNHVQVHQTRQDQTMQCNDCNYKTIKRRRLLNHLRKVHKNGKVQKNKT